jgi:hypothetical protein
MRSGRYLSPRPLDKRTVSRLYTWAYSRIRSCLPCTSWVRTNFDLVLATWQDEVGEEKFTMDGDIHECGAARIAKKEHDKGRRRQGKIHKKRLHILFDQNSKAFQGWEAVIEPWSLTTCEQFIEWCHIGKAFPPSSHGIHRKHNVANLKYCMWPGFKE